MKRLVTAVILVLAIVCCVAVYFARQAQREEQPQVGKRPLWEEFNYQQQAGAKEQQFIVLGQVAAKPGAREARGRIAFALQDNRNYYFTELSDKEVWLGKVENGFELRIGTRSATGLAGGGNHEVIIKRHSAPIEVALDGVVVATAYDDTFGAGGLALGSIGKGMSFADMKVQPMGEIYRSDDFMRNEGEQGLWEVASGNWQVNAINNPTMSTNAFYYIGCGSPEAAATWGFWFWNDYSFRVACKPLGDTAIGIYSYYKNKDNYYLFKWTASTASAPKMQLIRRLKATDTVLAEKPGGYTANQWYVLRCDVSSGKIRAFIDDLPMLEADDTSICVGKVGLFVDSMPGAQFDDALVKSVRGFSDDFRTFSMGRWTELGGAWRLVSSGGKDSPQGHTSFVGTKTDGSAKAITGEARWTDYILSADVGPCRGGRAGLCFYYQDELNYYALLTSGDSDAKRQLVKVVDGNRSVMAHDVAPAKAECSHVAVRLDKGHVTVTCNGAPVFEEFDNTFREGKIGLVVEEASEVPFGNVHVEFVTEKPPLMTVHEVFSRERTMEEWAGEQSDWATRTDTVAGATFQTHWHRADFPGDVDIEMKAPAEFPANAQLKLMLASNEENLDGGYCFTLAHTGSYKATLLRRGTLVGSADIDEKAGMDQLLFRRVGSYIVAFLGSRAILSYRDREPLTGVKVGWGAANATVKKQDIEVYSDCVQNYTFKEAASDWRIASGIWEVTNRWQCDPRWSFFSGRSQRLAAIWNKRELTGDTTLEFYAGIKMDAERGRKYEYASDMNATLCADGNDLTSGYNFLFGGWHDQRSAIMKGDKIVVETAASVIPREDNIHRRWFYLKARKHGNRLEFYVDNNRILEYEDKQPLTGTRAAIWTYNNGLMVSRVRLSCVDAHKKEAPAPPHPEQCKCAYDLPTAAAPPPAAAPAK